MGGPCFLVISYHKPGGYLNVNINPIDPVVKYIGLVILGGLLNSQDVFIVPIDKTKCQPQHNILSFHCLPLYFLFNTVYIFLILNFRHVLIVVSFLLVKSTASVYYYMPTFWNSLLVPSSKVTVEH